MNRWRWLPLVAALALGGCDALDRFQSPEARINRAVPVDVAVEVARQRVLSEAQARGSSAAVEQIERGLAERLKLRSLHCKTAVAITWQSTPKDIAERSVDRTCLRGQDLAIVNWLGLQRVRLALAQAPLRPVPVVLPQFVAALSALSAIDFADKAGIALAYLPGSPSQIAALDLESGRELWRGTANALKAQALSANGRVFVSPDMQGPTRIRSAESGEELAALHRVTSVSWLGTEAALVHLSRAAFDNGGWRLLDLVSGKYIEIAGLDARHQLLVPAPGDGRQFVGLGRLMQRMTLHGGGAGPDLRIDIEAPAPMPQWQSLFGAAAGGRYVEGTDGQLHVVALTDLQTQSVALPSTQVSRVVPTPNPDELIISLRPGRGAPSRDYLLSLSQQTLGAIERVGDPNDEQRYLWIGPFGRVGVLRNGKVEVLGEVKAGPRTPIREVLDGFIEENNRRKLDAAEVESARFVEHTWARPTAALLQPEPALDAAAIARLSRDAKIEGIGIERAEPAPLPGSKRLAEGVRVQARQSSRPLVIVLAAREPVRWSIGVEPGASIAAVLLSGDARSSVEATGIRPPVFRLGATVPLDGDGPEFMKLQQQMKDLTGRAVQSFQHRRAGVAFAVGG